MRTEISYPGPPNTRCYYYLLRNTVKMPLHVFTPAVERIPSLYTSPHSGLQRHRLVAVFDNSDLKLTRWVMGQLTAWVTGHGSHSMTRCSSVFYAVPTTYNSCPINHRRNQIIPNHLYFYGKWNKQTMPSCMHITRGRAGKPASV